MTDNEIIKALDICGHLEACADCPLGCLEGVDKCMHTLLLNALDLINRKNAEIERLQSVNADVQESLRLAAEANKDMQAWIERLQKSTREMFVTISQQDAEIGKWKAECENQSVLWRDHFESIFESAKETIQAEAIKEFAKRLTEHLGFDFDSSYDALQEVLKEMTEEKK